MRPAIPTAVPMEPMGAGSGPVVTMPCFQCGQVNPTPTTLNDYGQPVFQCRNCGAWTAVNQQGRYYQDDGMPMCIPICIPCTIM